MCGLMAELQGLPALGAVLLIKGLHKVIYLFADYLYIDFIRNLYYETADRKMSVCWLTDHKSFKVSTALRTLCDLESK